VLVSSLPFCLLPTKRTRTAAPASLASSGPRGDRASTSRAPPPARRSGPPTRDGGCPCRARLPRFGFGNYSPSLFCLCAALLRSPSLPPPLLKALLFASIRILRRVKNSCLRVLISQKKNPRFGHGCSVHRGVSQFR